MSKLICNPTPISVSKRQQAREFYLQLKSCLEVERGGGSNPEALRRIQNSGLLLKRVSGQFAEKVASFLGYAEILYSSRKHRRWDNPYQSGAEAVAHFMRCDLVSIGDILERMID